MTRVVNIEEYGYPKGSVVSIKDPTPKIMGMVNEYKRKVKDEQRTGVYLLSLLIIDAPFKADMETLDELPMSLITHLSLEVQDMTLPLDPKMREKSLKLIEEAIAKTHES